MTVALIERKLFGGTCVNTGCIPTKTMVASAYAAHLARRAADYGVTLGGPVGVDMQSDQGAQGQGVGRFPRRARDLDRAAWTNARSFAAMRGSNPPTRCASAKTF